MGGYQAYPYNYNYNYGIPATSYYNVPRVYHSYGKREADAEPEADPALIYTNTLPFTPAVHSPIVYKTLPLAEKTEQTEKVSTPLVYTHAMPFHQPLVYKTLPEAEKIEKTEKVFTPEVYTHALPLHQPFVYNSAVQTPLVYNTPVQTPLVYNSAVQTPLVYKTPVQTPLLKTVDNAVVPAVGGYIHSSHVGVCTNNLGIRVPC